MPVGVAGELFIGGVGLARGYLNRPELTAERFVPDPFAPGRRAALPDRRPGAVPGGRGVRVPRPPGHQVKLRGFRIELGEIEAGAARRIRSSSEAVVVMLRRGSDAGVWQPGSCGEVPGAR